MADERLVQRLATDQRLKERAAKVSLAYNASQTVLKLIAAVLTGSLSLMAEALHSGIDILASLFALFGIRIAAAPPDEEHPYGHGKSESLASFGESALMVGTVGYVGFRAVGRLMEPAPVEKLDFGIAVIVVSIATSLMVGRYVMRIARQTGSLALLSNGQHLMVDFWTSAGVLFALIGTKLTGWHALDAVTALVLSVWLMIGAARLGYQALQQLIDRRLSDEEVERVRAIIVSRPEHYGYHRLRTRQSGHVRSVDFHLVVPREWSVVQAHELADDLEKAIAAELAPASVVVHVDPYDPEKAGRMGPDHEPLRPDNA